MEEEIIREARGQQSFKKSNLCSPTKEYLCTSIIYFSLFLLHWCLTQSLVLEPLSVFPPFFPVSL